MTGETHAKPPPPGIGSGQTSAEPDLARFFQDWSVLWLEELRAQAAEARPAAMPGAEMWRAAMALWTDALPSALAARDPAAHRARGAAPGAAPGLRLGATAAAAAPDPRDAEIERLTRRVDELEARLARLEAPRRRRG